MTGLRPAMQRTLKSPAVAERATFWSISIPGRTSARSFSPHSLSSNKHAARIFPSKLGTTRSSATATIVARETLNAPCDSRIYNQVSIVEDRCHYLFLKKMPLRGALLLFLIHGLPG